MLQAGAKWRRYRRRVQNAGWRIQWIEAPETGTKTNRLQRWLPLFVIIGGLSLLVLSVALVRSGRIALWGLSLGIAGLVLIAASRYLVAWLKYRKWVRLPARCVDVELRSFPLPQGGQFWSFRLRCLLELDGCRIHVTPVNARAMGFQSKRAVETYLKRTIKADTSCFLWVNPDRPFECAFHRRPLWA